MGRAIVRDPKVFLFDEPLSNLDAKLRVAMRAEIKALHQRLKTTTVYVTHDQVEAMTMADRIVVMHDGRIEQIGEPLELYDHPDNLFVAQFIGSPAMNVVNGSVKRANGGGVRRHGRRRAWPLQQSPGDGRPAGRLRRAARRSRADQRPAPRTRSPARSSSSSRPAPRPKLLIQAGQAQLILVTHGRPDVNPGDRVGLAVDAGQGARVRPGHRRRVAARKQSRASARAAFPRIAVRRPPSFHRPRILP